MSTHRPAAGGASVEARSRCPANVDLPSGTLEDLEVDQVDQVHHAIYQKIQKIQKSLQILQISCNLPNCAESVLHTLTKWPISQAFIARLQEKASGAKTSEAPNVCKLTFVTSNTFRCEVFEVFETLWRFCFVFLSDSLTTKSWSARGPSGP